jgi:hypothetical protein
MKHANASAIQRPASLNPLSGASAPASDVLQSLLKASLAGSEKGALESNFMKLKYSNKHEPRSASDPVQIPKMGGAHNYLREFT